MQQNSDCIDHRLVPLPPIGLISISVTALPPSFKQRGARALVNFGFRGWSHLTPERPVCHPAAARLPAAPATSRGSTGHAWSAGFDWAAVVVVTGKRRRSEQTVPGAARSPLLPYPLPSPAPPAGWSPAPTALPMASALVRRGWGAPPRS